MNTSPIDFILTRARVLKSHLRCTLAALVVAGLSGLGFFQQAHGAAPLAGSAIGNQASATYTDASNTPHTATSNITLTVVQQVASLTLNASQSKAGSPGGQIVFPHTLINTGNGPDTFTLSATNLGADNFDLTGLALYADANGDGMPDGSTPVTSTGQLAVGARFQFVAVGLVPSSQTSTQTAQIRVNAVSGFDAAKTLSNTDTVTVSSHAVVQTSLSVNPSSGSSPSGPYTYTLTFTNTGNVAATALTLTNTLPAGITYIAGTARWSVSGTTALTDAAGGDPAGISYDFGQTVVGRLTAVINSLAAGQSGTLTFQGEVPAGVPSGALSTNAQFSYNDGAGNVGPYDTNTVTVLVRRAPSLTFTGNTVPSAVQGGTVIFDNVLTNTGLSTETFEITLNGSTFPAGTTFRLVRADGVTSLLDSNGNATVDTGPLAPGATFHVLLRATLPTGATGGAYTINKKATAATDPTATATATDTLTAITASSVDLTGDVDGLIGVGPGPGLTPQVTLTANPGVTVTFPLTIKNTSSTPDSFDLSVSSVDTFVVNGLPPGWTVVFRRADGTVITRSDVIAPGGSQTLYADVTSPAAQAPGTQAVYFRVYSPVTGSTDSLYDAVALNAVRSLAVTPNNSGQVFPGGTAVFSHTLINTGNALEGDGSGSSVTLTSSVNLPGWSTALYYDANGNGMIDAGEEVISDVSFVSNGAAGLAPGETIRLLVKVFAPADAAVGAGATVTVTATTVNGSHTSTVAPVATATNALTVVLAEIKLVKEHSLDANADGIGELPHSTSNIMAGSVPGACICYRITVTNIGTEAALDVVVNDVTPTFTTYHALVPAAASQGTVASTPADGSAGALVFNLGTLAPGASATVTFNVKIDQ